MFSIYTSWFSVERMRFQWREALQNWVQFLTPIGGQIVIAVNTSDDNTSTLVRDYIVNWKNLTQSVAIEVFDITIPYTDPEFDGKGKAIALEKCRYPYVILLDCDERLIPTQQSVWLRLVGLLEQNHDWDGIFIPVVDLVGDINHYKLPVGQKWYLHRNHPNITRGVWRGGYKTNGLIDTSKSDTCEAIYKNNRELIRAVHLDVKNEYLENGIIPMIYHLGFLDAEQRLRQSAFWEPVWSLREGKNVKTERTLEDLEKIPRYRHNFPLWK